MLFYILFSCINKLLILDKGNVIAYGKTKELFRLYCGNAIFIVENNQKNKELTSNFQILKSPNHLIKIWKNNAKEICHEISIIIS
mgnify:CR=1 FL=1